MDDYNFDDFFSDPDYGDDSDFVDFDGPDFNYDFESEEGGGQGVVDTSPSPSVFTEEVANPASPGDPAYGWRYFSDGTAIDPKGTYYFDGQPVWSPKTSSIPRSVVNSLISAFKKPGGGTDWSRVAAAAGGAAGLMGINRSPERVTGFQGKVPNYTAVREQVAGAPDPDRRPGGINQRYFSDLQYATPENVAAARTAAQEQAAGIAAAQRPPQPDYLSNHHLLPAQDEAQAQEAPPEQQMAAGGIATLAKGRYLKGPTDGMTDELPAKINKKQPAALSHGEFVIPADVVSHLGNGNSEAGAKQLYAMMDRIRLARTGNSKQGKQINPKKHIPA